MISVLIVLYNKKIDDSLTYKRIKKRINELSVIVFDNSKKEFVDYNKKYASKNKISYYTLNENVGISKAYNYVIKKMILNDTDYIVIMDDDTNINNEYIDELMNLVKEGKYDIILPKIKAGNMFISPAKVQFNCRIHAVKSFDELNSTNISAINSGMIIRTSVFNKIDYNEKLFLDYVDHDFMKQARTIGCKFKIMDTIIEQNYSRFQKNDLDKEIIRFKIYLKDFKEYCKECNNVVFYHFSVLKYKIHQVLKYKSVRFMFVK